MRFCPFCSAENVDDAGSCTACGRRLPPLPNRRHKAAGAPTADVTTTVTTVAPVAPVAPVVSAPPTPPPPAPAPIVDDSRRALATALVPAPAALRRTAPPPEPRAVGAEARRHADVAAAPADATLPVDDAWLMDPSEVKPVIPTLVTSVAPPPPPAPHLDPPPTRVVRIDSDERPFIPPTVMPVPETPEPGLLNAARYAVGFNRARWQRRRAVKLLHAEIKSDTGALDGVLLTLGRSARARGVDNRTLAAENLAITEAEQRRETATTQGTEVLARRDDENVKFEAIERERLAKVSDAERVLAEDQRELGTCEAQRRGLRDKKKDLERRQKAYLSAAEQRETEAERSPMGDARAELRRAGEGHRREAASLDPERQDLERKLAALERPLSAAQAKGEAAKAEVEAVKRTLADAREGHRHRVAELDAEHGRKLREHELIDNEILRRMVTLGTLINLHRVDQPEFVELYQRIDRLRTAINARSTEIDRLTAERSAYDRPSLLRGYAVLAGVVVALIAFVAIILAAT